ncbi:hypothetical protein SDC9_176341 [bioreactor metagenome]|uniref:Uncharacterized protein n=1 Tax=bioreactor metagenome TaxID=1076179 RepID=A0A645GRQ4_9ZZZZ
MLRRPGIAQPVLRVGRQRGGRVLLHEAGEGGGRFRVFRCLEEVEGGVVAAGFRALIAGHRRLRAGIAAGRRRGLEAAQPAVEVEIEILLPLLGLFQFVAQGFDLAAQAGDFFRLTLDLCRQFELGPGLLVEARLAGDLQVSDLAPGLVVVKQRPGRLAAQEPDQHQQRQAAHDQNSPRPSGAR